VVSHVFFQKKHPPKWQLGSFQEGGRAGIAAFGCQTTDILELHTSALAFASNAARRRSVGGGGFFGGVFVSG